MIVEKNASGKPLASSDWLENHHNAKKKERRAFAKKLAEFKPKSIVDLGCATGLWLDLFDEYLPSDCSFVGIDSDEESLNIAKERSKKWKRESSFMILDLETNANDIPPCDLTLAFNIFPYIKDLDRFVDILSRRVPRGILAIRQYDGASIRFGPMPTKSRQTIECDLRLSTENSSIFKHYDMDRTFECLKKSKYSINEYDFELFKRISPFPEEFLPYYTETLKWTAEHISEKSSNYLLEWLENDTMRYFYEVDLVAILS